MITKLTDYTGLCLNSEKKFGIVWKMNLEMDDKKNVFRLFFLWLSLICKEFCWAKIKPLEVFVHTQFPVQPTISWIAFGFYSRNSHIHLSRKKTFPGLTWTGKRELILITAVYTGPVCSTPAVCRQNVQSEFPSGKCCQTSYSNWHLTNRNSFHLHET